MAHWFHRNVLKATTNQKFELKITDPTDATRKLCSDLKLSRSRLLELIKNPNNSSDTIEPAFHSYLSLLYGFIWEINSAAEQSEHVGRPNPSKLRNVIVYKWTHTLLGLNTYITMNEAKDVHTMLRRAAGIFTFVQTEFLPQLANPPPLGSDLDPRIINAYVNQCTAEAQEVTVARAVELKHNASLISALANETSKLFLDAANTLRPFKPEISAQWIKYLELKAAFYQSYAYNYCGENLLAMDKCGEAIKALQESEACLKKAKMLCQEYGKINGPAPRVKPDQHAVFKRLAPIVKLTLDKCNHENGLIYHHLIPGEVPTLDTKATFGLVSPIDFQMQSHHSVWNLNVYRTLSGLNPAKLEKEQNLPPVKEDSIHQTTKDPKNTSG
ncbi:unnamed protein product, partial [Heterotrigona itama]